MTRFDNYSQGCSCLCPREMGRMIFCGCNSGKLARDCCARLLNSKVPQHIFEQFEDIRRTEAQRISSLGHVRPVITETMGDTRFVAVGSQLHFVQKQNSTFHDFLARYIQGVMGEKWGMTELQKPLEERHPVLQWYQCVCEHQGSAIETPGEVAEAIATGPVLAYLSLAYDLYILQHHQVMQDLLLKRLRQVDQFQGARYETFVTAAFIKANFEVSPENENDSTRSHCEFSATHRPTGRQCSVEAKSRKRAGFLGHPGEKQRPETIRADVYRLLQDALRKEAEHPRIVFIDVNMPPSSEILQGGWAEIVSSQITRLEESQRIKEPWPPAIIVLTNHPYHYVGPLEPAPEPTVLITAINTLEFLRLPTDSKDDYRRISQEFPHIMDLSRSLFEHTSIPTSFPKTD